MDGSKSKRENPGQSNGVLEDQELNEILKEQRQRLDLLQQQNALQKQTVFNIIREQQNLSQ